MISSVRKCPGCVVAWFVLLCFASSLFGQSGLLRLRNEPIATPEKAARAAANVPARAPEMPHSGLFLIQFTGAPQSAWLQQLRAAGVSMVQYVPDHAFVARASGVRVKELESLPFVRWTGPFKPEHKVHGEVAARKQQAGDLEVSVLLAPDSTPQQLGAARGLLKRLNSQASMRMGHVWRGTLSLAQLSKLAESDAVLWIESAPKMKLVDETASKIVGGDSGGHATYVQALGYDGSGVVVSVADSGLDSGDIETMHPDLFGRVVALFFYGDLEDASDEHSHGTHVAGIVAGSGATGELDDYGTLWGLGVAPGASIIAQRMFDGEGGYEAPPSFATLTTDAMEAGADIGSNSWGDDTQGRYDISAAEFDALVRDGNTNVVGDQGYILEFSAGNAGPGPQTIGSPAVGKNVIATGASQNDRFDYFLYADGREVMADFSSRGPAEDGRIKPDIIAPGTWISSARSVFANDEFAWGDISANYMFQGGTSQAGPHASGAAAVFVQYFRQLHTNATPSPALVKAALINSAWDIDEAGPTPNSDEGWGRVDLEWLLGDYRAYDYVDQSVKLTTGQTFERRIVVTDVNQPLVITLAYTDVPGFPGALIALVNDLDLEVIAPDGQAFHGNQFDEGESIAGAPGFDNINNVEGIYVSFPQLGEYAVRIHARNVVSDARTDSPEVDQDFALVSSALMPAPGEGVMLFDRIAYTAPSRINLKVIDPDLGSQPSVSITLKSTTESSGFAVTLNAQFPGTFTGSVATATGAAANDNVLQFQHGDWIRAEYFDASAGILRIGNAVGDLQPPIISGVMATNRFGQALIVWATDELATSVARYNSNSILNLAVTNTALVMEHSIELPNLIPGRTYFFAVSSTDAAGNTSTNNNFGSNFNFVAPSAPTVLIVDAFTESPEPDDPPLPISTYTDALDGAGISYDVYRVTNSSSSPTLQRLLPYKVVMWRINDSFNMQGDTLTSQQQGVITNYLNAGGSFFMASMEILSRLGTNSPFVTNVFRVARFSPNELLFEPCPDCDEDHTVPEIEGESTDPIGRDVQVALDYSMHPMWDLGIFVIGPDLSDTFGIKRSANPVFYDVISGEPCGMSFPRTGNESPGRVVFFSFPLDAIPLSGTAPNTRAEIVRRIVRFLVPGLDGVGTIAMDREGYTIPDLVTIEVGDLDLAGAGAINIECHTSDVTTPVTVTLTETARRGLFRGTATLAPLASSPGPGILRAQNGSTIFARYVDDSSSLTIEATAVVDLNAPLISSLTVDPDYQEATVSWETTELTDALVEYGESPFLGRTVYIEDLDFYHEVTLPNLKPDSLYYFRVTSRDVSGNVVRDDNNGQLYTFQTLQPVLPPFAQSFDAGADNWSVFDGEDSQTTWTLGVPDNTVETSAFSAPNAWGSSLKGDIADYIDTFLISPAIHLTGGNAATLRFQTSYDFSERSSFDLLEYGELLVFTNNSSYVTLSTFEDISGGWYEEEFDLSPYVGQVIYLVWHHQLLAFDSAQRPGWLIDDVSVTVSSTPHGTLVVTNNLSQGSFTIAGPIGVTIQGSNYRNTNAPPGDYTVTFNDVQFYSTPSPQSGALAANATLTLGGTYTFADANANGMSDDWETNFFGSVSPGRTQLADTDGDGMKDYAEFIAGTSPTNAASFLRFTTLAPQVTGVTRLDWPTVPSRSYRVLGSADLVAWQVAQDWIRANGNVLSFTTPSTNGLRFFRLEVKP